MACDVSPVAMFNFPIQNFSGRFDTSGSMIPRLVHKIEGGYPERDIGAEEEEEGQGWGDSRRLMQEKGKSIILK